MKCNLCGQESMFRARPIGKPFLWWCQACYDTHQHPDLPHDTEWPLLCHDCREQPANFRSKGKVEPWWKYWCYTCFERTDDHLDDVADIEVRDLDSASEDELDDDEYENDEHAEVESCSSLNSWLKPDACNLEALELDAMSTQSNARDDDTVSMSSSNSFNLVFSKMDNDDTASVSSFQMEPQQQEQHAHAQQEQQQDLDQDPHEEPDQSQLELYQEPHQECSFGSWQEEQEVLLALEVSLQDVGHDSSNHSSSSSSSSSNSSSSSAASAPPTLELPRVRNQKKVPRWPLSDVQVPNSGKPKVPKAFKTGLAQMQTIDEVVGTHDEIHTCAYVDSSGCKQTIFTDKSTTSTNVVMCPMHLQEYRPHCRACEEYRFMQTKHQFDVAMAQSIEDSYNTGSIIFIDQLPCCSSHGQELRQWCDTCMKVVVLRDQMA